MAAGNPGTDSLTLDTAIRQTLDNNPQLYRFRYTREQLEGEKELSSLRPQYIVGVEAENFAGSGTYDSFDSLELTIALSSVLELGGKRDARVGVAGGRLETFEMQRKADTLDLLGNLASSFILVLTTQEEIKLAAEAAKLSQDLVDTVSVRAERGAAPDSEVMRAKAMLIQARILQVNLQHKLDRQKVSLVRFWGTTEPQFGLANGDIFDFGNSTSFEALYAQVQQTPAVEVFATQARLRDAELKLAQTQNRADFTWAVGARRLESTNDTALVAAFSVPLFAKKRNEGAMAAATANRNAVSREREAALLELHNRLYTAYSQRQQFIETHALLEQEIIPELEEALKQTRSAYDRGRLRYQDWIAAQQELLNAKRQLIETASAVLLNQAVIEQLTAVSLQK